MSTAVAEIVKQRISHVTLPLKSLQLKIGVISVHYKKHSTFKSTACSVDNRPKILKGNGEALNFDVFPVRTKDFQDTVIKICHSRNDKWSETVLSRLAYMCK